jgi:hypothetical protein
MRRLPWNHVSGMSDPQDLFELVAAFGCIRHSRYSEFKAAVFEAVICLVL